jgi:hypothetical protein
LGWAWGLITRFFILRLPFPAVPAKNLPQRAGASDMPEPLTAFRGWIVTTTKGWKNV